MNWYPLIVGNKKSAFQKKLSEIAGTISANIHCFKDNNGIVADRLGVVLFLFYYSRFSGEDKYADYGLDLLSTVLDEVNRDLENGAHEYSANRLAGVGWVLEHLEQNCFLDIDTDEILEEVDKILYDVMIINMQKRQYDYLTGALQKGIYFLNRLRNAEVRDYLAHLVDVLDRVCDRDQKGGLMFREQTPHGELLCNLGLAHGMPGIAWFLGKMKVHGIAEDKAVSLLDGFVTYILRQVQDTSQFTSNFPMMVVGDGHAANSRLAWCYGDLGIGIALWQTSRDRGNREWEQEVLRVLHHSAQRKELKGNNVVDAGLCHGTAGIAHIFSRLFHYTGKEEFKDAALYWSEETLKMATFEDGYAGFKCWKGEGEKENEWVQSVDLFDGVSGIGLALISAISEIEPKWDRALLLS